MTNKLNECKHECIVKYYLMETKCSKKKSLPPLNSQFHCQPAVHPCEYFLTTILFYL